MKGSLRRQSPDFVTAGQFVLEVSLVWARSKKARAREASELEHHFLLSRARGAA